MWRRAFIILLGALTSAYSGNCSAQSRPSEVYRLGFLAPARLPREIDALQDGLRRLGYIEGQNLKTEYRFLEGGATTLDELAAEVVRLHPDIIVTLGTPPVIALKRATTTIPIVMLAGDPLASGIVARLAHPGGNITGLTLYASELTSKRLEVFKEAVPGITRIAVLANAKNQAEQLLWQEAEKAARPLALVARLFTVQEAADLPAVFDAIVQDGANGVVVLPDVMLDSVRSKIVALAAEHRLPAMYHRRDFIQDGGLISYGPNMVELLTRRSAAYVDKILKGAKPGDLPVEQPTNFEMVINLRTAKALGLTIPVKLLTVADEVIE
jgi:putative ABC transport system substrate-binding protein